MEASETQPLRAEPWWQNSLMVTFSFTCNLGCSFCMVEDALDVFPGTSLATFEKAAREPERVRGVNRIIFSGGEVTLDEQLLDYAKLARSIPGVEHVRLQTNATRLVRRDYLDALLSAGVDEYFISIHGHDEALCDDLTRRKGSFKAILAGLEAVRERGASFSTNTAIVRPNYPHLAAIVELIAPFGPRSMEFWNYWPRTDDDGARELAAKVADVRPHLIQALQRCVTHEIPPVVKWFPRCLLGEHGVYQDDGQPPALIEEGYWDKEPAYACLYEGVCADREPVCSGLSHSYIERFGWEEQLLVPRRSAAAGTELGAVERSLLRDPAPERGESAIVATWLDKLGVTAERVFAEHRLAACSRTSDRKEVKASFAGAHGNVDVFVRGRDPSRPCSLRTPSFDILAMRPPPGREAEVVAVVRAVARALLQVDHGGLSLPA